MTVEVMKKVGRSWVVVVYKGGQVIDWRPAPSIVK